MLDVNKKKKYILRPLTKTMRTKIKGFENLHKSRLTYTLSRCGLELKIGNSILMSVVKKLKHGYIVYFYNGEYLIGEFKFLPNSEVNFITKDSVYKDMRKDVVIGNWRDYREYDDYIKNYIPIEVKHENNLIKIQSLKNELERVTEENNRYIQQLEYENKEIEENIK